jgi:hypothetical protein
MMLSHHLATLKSPVETVFLLSLVLEIFSYYWVLVSFSKGIVMITAFLPPGEHDCLQVSLQPFVHESHEPPLIVDISFSDNIFAVFSSGNFFITSYF